MLWNPIRSVPLAGSLAAIFFAIQPAAAVVIHTSDFIAAGDRTNFAGFEPITSVAEMYTGEMGPYFENGIRIQQINGDGGTDIWVSYSWGQEGSYSWYPNGGDSGYTRITRSDGSDFSNVGFLRGSGNPLHSTLWYDLLDNGVSVLSGTVSHASSAQYLGFSGGGFDEIRLRDGNPDRTTGLYDRTGNALSIDSIELAAIPVPGPSTIALFGFGLAALGAARRRRVTP